MGCRLGLLASALEITSRGYVHFCQCHGSVRKYFGYGQIVVGCDFQTFAMSFECEGIVSRVGGLEASGLV